MKLISNHPVSRILIILLTLTGCATIQEYLKTDPLEGNPDKTGLMLATCRIIANFQDRSIWGTAFGVDQNGTATGGAITGVDNIELEGRAKNEVVAFPNLAPGTYKLVLMRGVRGISAESVKKIYNCPSDWDTEHNIPTKCPDGVEFEFHLPPPVQEQLTFEVVAGEVVFVGNLVFDEPHDPPYHNLQTSTSGNTIHDFHECVPNEKFQIERDPQTELDSLKKVVSGFKENSWTAKIRERIAVLEQEVGE